jgi:BMFP domain-containing protein YqiC
MVGFNPQLEEEFEVLDEVLRARAKLDSLRLDR